MTSTPRERRRIDRFIWADAKAFLRELNNKLGVWADFEWEKQCMAWKAKWPVWKEGTDESAGIDVYHFLDALGKAMPHDGTVICDAGSTFFAVPRGFPTRIGQRVIISGAQTDMGFALPGAVGACFAKGGGPVVAIQGDGSFQFNVQELQVLKHHNLPIKLFVWNNDGYLSIRASQDKSCDGRHIGTDSTCGISFPSVQKHRGSLRIAVCEACASRHGREVDRQDIGDGRSRGLRGDVPARSGDGSRGGVRCL